MKRILAIAMVFSFGLTVQAMAQKKDLKGPAYKNAHPSEKYAGNDELLVRGRQAQRVKGPAAKNRKAWETDKSEYREAELDKFAGKNTKGLKGPAYKNYRPKGKPKMNN